MTGTAPHKHNARCSQSKKQFDAHKVNNMTFYSSVKSIDYTKAGD